MCAIILIYAHSDVLGFKTSWLWG